MVEERECGGAKARTRKPETLNVFFESSAITADAQSFIWRPYHLIVSFFAMSAFVQVKYDLHPPADTPSNDLQSSKTHEFAVKPANERGKAYYEALRKAVVEAKTTLGAELTVWRDAVGNREQGKAAQMPQKAEDEDEEDGEEQ